MYKRKQQKKKKKKHYIAWFLILSVIYHSNIAVANRCVVNPSFSLSLYKSHPWHLQMCIQPAKCHRRWVTGINHRLRCNLPYEFYAIYNIFVTVKCFCIVCFQIIERLQSSMPSNVSISDSATNAGHTYWMWSVLLRRISLRKLRYSKTVNKSQDIPGFVFVPQPKPDLPLSAFLQPVAHYFGGA